MTEKRFEIVKSKLIRDGWVISDKLKQFTFPTLKGDKRALISYCKALNESHEGNKELKKKIEELEFKLRTIEAYDRTAKEEHSDTVYDFKKKLEKW